MMKDIWPRNVRPLALLGLGARDRGTGRVALDPVAHVGPLGEARSSGSAEVGITPHEGLLLSHGHWERTS
jgi:hypothetical protein